MEKTNRWLKTKFFNKKLIISSLLAMSFFICKMSMAQISIIYDEETELYLEKIAKPLFKSANVPFNRNNFYIVNDNSLNAFVSDGNSLFVNTGTIIKSENDDELSGVIAHEVGHIEGGHILRGKLKGQELSEAGLASMILAGAAAAISGRGDVGMAMILGSQNTMLNSYLNYRIEEERSADEAAVKLLEKNHISPEGMLNFMKKISQQNIASGIEENPYFRTHPVTVDRINFLSNNLKNSKYPPRNTGSEEYLRIKAKLIAFIYPPQKALSYYKKSNTIAEKYAHTIIYFKQMNIPKAIETIDGLIETEPQNPFFRELKAQIYMETGDIKNAEKEYKKALELLPNSAIFKLNFASAAIENNPNEMELKKLEKTLNQVLLTNPNYEVWILLARIYGMQNKMSEAMYASAQANLRIGLFEIAKKQANEALKNNKNPQISLKISDLIKQIEQLQN